MKRTVILRRGPRWLRVAPREAALLLLLTVVVAAYVAWRWSGRSEERSVQNTFDKIGNVLWTRAPAARQ